MPKGRSRSTIAVLICRRSAIDQAGIVRQRGRPRAAARGDETDDAADRRGIGAEIEAGDHFDQMQRTDGRDEIFADAAADQFAIELHIVDTADDDDLGRRIADLGQTVDLVERRLALQPRLHDQKIGRDLAGIMLDGTLHAAELNRDMRLGQPPVRRRALQRARPYREIRRRHGWRCAAPGRSCGAAPNRSSPSCTSSSCAELRHERLQAYLNAADVGGLVGRLLWPRSA